VPVACIQTRVGNNIFRYRRPLSKATGRQKCLQQKSRARIIQLEERSRRQKKLAEEIVENLPFGRRPK